MQQRNLLLYRVRGSFFTFVYAYIHCNLSAAVYYTAVATFAAIVGQHVVRRMIIVFGRASLIIFILAFMIFVSAISLGKYYISGLTAPLYLNFKLCEKF